MASIPNSYNLKRKTILLTGVNGQIGRGLVLALLKNGAFVYGADLQDEVDARLEKEISKKKLQRKFIYLKLNVTSEKSIETARKKMGRSANVLINNAGLGVYTPFEKRTEEEIDSVTNVNIKGIILCSKVFAKDMMKRKEGTIISIASIYGITTPDKRIYGDSGRNSSEIYSATKAGVVQLTRYLASYLGEYNITANAVSPGGIFNHQKKFFVDNYVNKTPLGRMARVEDLTGVICFLCSEEAKYITGQNIAVDGGFTVW